METIATIFMVIGIAYVVAKVMDFVEYIDR